MKKTTENTVIRLILIGVIFCILSCKEQGKLEAKDNKVAGVNIYDGKRLEFNGKLEPPAPDPIENDKTLLGIDSNDDGIRDDVERWINRKAKKNEYLRFLLRSSVKYEFKKQKQNNVSAEELYSWISTSLNLLSSCRELIIYQMKEVKKENYYIASRTLDALIYNTKSRILHNSEISKKISGKAFVSPKESEAKKNCNLEERMKNDY
jgi:hypothetical protein